MAEIPLGLLGLAAGLMRAGEPSPTPLGFGGALSRGLMGGLQGYAEMQRFAQDDRLGRLREAALMQRMGETGADWQIIGDQQSGYFRASPSRGEVEQLVAGMPGASKTRTLDQGEFTITQELDPRTLQWKEIARAPRWQPQAGDTQLVEIYDPTSPTGTKFVPRSETAGMPGQPPSSAMQITGYDESGRPLIQIGGRGSPAAPGNIPLGTAATNKVQGEVTDLIEKAARIDQIGQAWNPEYQTYNTQLWNSAIAQAEKFGIPVPGEYKQQLADYTKTRQNILSNVNSTIREITGAAMTQGEAERIMGELPNESDSPTEFWAKYQNSARLTKLALARRIYLLKNGIPTNTDALTGGIELRDMPAVIDRRGQEIEAQLREAGVPDEQVRDQVKARLKEEFGI